MKSTKTTAVPSLQAKAKLYLTAIVAGYATLTLESTGTALLAPYFGATSQVWNVQIATALIGVFLGYLAGRRFPVVHTGTWLLAGGIYTFTLTQLASSLLPLSYGFSYWPALITTSTLLYLPGATLINAVYPTLASEASPKSEDAFVAVAATGTIGALAALANNLWLPDTIGLRLTLSLATGLVTLLGIWHQRPTMTTGWFAAFSLTTAMLPTARPSEPTVEKARWETSEGLTQVVESRGSRMLLHNGICQTITTPTLAATPLIETAIALATNNKTRTALAIGVGGGSFPTRLNNAGIVCESVDSSQTMVRAAVTHFGFNSNRTTLTDGRRYLATHQTTYDFIFLDAFSGDEPAGYLLTKEAAALLRSRISKDGYLTINLVATSFDPLDPLNSAVINTFRTVFPYVAGWQIGENNLLVVAGNTPIPPPPGISAHEPTRQALLLTDNRNPARRLYATIGQALREKQRECAKAGLE